MPKKRQNRAPRRISVDHIQTGSLSLVDDFGTERARLACRAAEGGTGGYTVFHLKGDDGAPRLMMQLDDKGNSAIALFGVGGKLLLSINTNGDTGNGVTICDLNGYPLVQIGVPGSIDALPTDGEPGVVVRDGDGKTTIITPSGVKNRQES